MENNFTKIINNDKISTNITTTITDENKEIIEEMMSADCVPTVVPQSSTLFKKRRFTSEDIDFENKKDDEIIKINPDIKPESKLESKPKIRQEIRESYSELSDKSVLIRDIKSFKLIDEHIDIPNVNTSMTVKELYDIKLMMKRKWEKTQTAESLWNTMIIILYLIEQLIAKIGYDVNVNGWTDSLTTKKRLQMGYFEEMMEDKIIFNEETGKIEKIKNSGWMSSLNTSPQLKLIMSIFISLFSYFTMSNAYFALNFKTKNNYNNEEDLFKNMDIPTDDDLLI